MRKIVLIGLAGLAAGFALPAAAPTAPAPKINFVSNETVQPTPADEGPPTGDVPICKQGEEDNCINSWEANRTGNRPINYWPGRPASEIDEPLPVDQPDR